MKEQDIRVAMAEIDGYKFIKDWTDTTFEGGSAVGDVWQYPDGSTHWAENSDLPNYPQDLNAIAEFRKRHITFNLEDTYCVHLYSALNRDISSELIERYEYINATPLQHCEALIKTLAPEKWKEE